MIWYERILKGTTILAVIGSLAILGAFPAGAEKATEESKASKHNGRSHGRGAVGQSEREAEAKDKSENGSKKEARKTLSHRNKWAAAPTEQGSVRRASKSVREEASYSHDAKGTEAASTAKAPESIYVARGWRGGHNNQNRERKIYNEPARGNPREVSSEVSKETQAPRSRNESRWVRRSERTEEKAERSRWAHRNREVETSTAPPEVVTPKAITSGEMKSNTYVAPPPPSIKPRAYRPNVKPTSITDLHQAHNRWQEQLRERIHRENSQISAAEVAKQERRVIHVPGGKAIRPRIVHRPAIHKSYKHIRHRFGTPRYHYTFIPRPVRNYSVSYWLKYDGKLSAGIHYGVPHHRHHRHRRPVSLVFYYPYYYDDPYYTGFWYAGYYPNAYYYYGWMPRWCNTPGIVVYRQDPYPVYYGRHPGYGWPGYYYSSGAPSMDWRGVDRALVDLRYAWLEGDIDRFSYYIRQNEKISVYFDNDYSYSLSADDYYTMSLDAMNTIRTLDIVFSEPTWINSREIFVTGQHIFQDPDNERQTVYISYRLHRFDGRWYIIGIGSSPQPIKNIYKDFR